MANNYYTVQPGIGSVGSYQMSGIPWASSSVAPAFSADPLVPTKIEFPLVTKFIVVKNTNPTSANLRVGFSANGIVTDNYFLLGKGESFEGSLRITELYLIGDGVSQVSASVIAGLTGIDANNLTNSWSGSAGVG